MVLPEILESDSRISQQARVWSLPTGVQGGMMAIAEKRTIEVNPDEASTVRLALENQIITLLRFWGDWTARSLESFLVYQKFGGYFERESFEEMAKRGNGK